MPMAVRSKAWVCGRSSAEIVGSNPGGHGCLCPVGFLCWSDRGLRDKLITRPEESYRLWCVVVCDLDTSRMRGPWPALGRRATENKKKYYIILNIVLQLPTVFSTVTCCVSECDHESS